jgi:ferritin-like metal-binding protein YciE
MKIQSLHDLYLEELRDLYDAETQLLKALPKMAEKASSEDLRDAFQEHLQVTQSQVERLDEVFEMLEQKSKGKKCEGMKGLIEEAKDIMSQKIEPDVLDAGLIAAAQKIEHYEIAGYGCVRTYAEILGYDDQAELLQETLDEEKETDEELTELAKETINIEAAEHEPAEKPPRR